MLAAARAGLKPAASAAPACAARPALVQARNMATLKEIQIRLKSVSNISKITKSMKMIASTKMSKAQKNMDSAISYGETSNIIFTHAETPSKIEGEAPKTLLIACSSDRGLCGGIHSSISRAVKKHLKEHPDTTSVAIIGEKAKAQIARDARDKIAMHFAQVAKDVPNFTEAATIADYILASNLGYSNYVIYFNRFKSVIAFETSSMSVFSEKMIKASPKITAYEFEDEVLKNLEEFAFANALYHAIAEGNASEMAAKRMAMENATKNANEMISKLQLLFNRTRQAAITGELIDIVVGASAV